MATRDRGAAARRRCVRRGTTREAGRLTIAHDRQRIARALLFQGDGVALHELARSGPAERDARDDRPAQAVVRPTIMITRAGCATFTRVGRHVQRIVSDPARVIFLHAGDTYRVHYPVDGAYRATVVTFADDLAPAVRDAVAASAPLLLRLHACRRALLASTPDRDQAADVERTSHTIAALAAADAGTASTPAHRDLAEHACAMLAAAPADAHRLPELARALGVSPFFLARVFRAQVGISVHQYLLRLRLGLALERVAHGEPNLSALAVSLGFATHSHFTAAFTRAYGASPRTVRATLSGAWQRRLQQQRLFGQD